MARLEIVTGVERRRRWSDEAKLQILAEADEPGARIGEVARRHDIYPAQIRSWRQSFSAPDNLRAFVPVNLVDSDAGGLAGRGRGRGAGAPIAQSSMIEIALRNGRSLKAPADIDRRTLASLIACVEAA
jgi:transposase